MGNHGGDNARYTAGIEIHARTESPRSNRKRNVARVDHSLGDLRILCQQAPGDLILERMGLLDREF